MECSQNIRTAGRRQVIVSPQNCAIEGQKQFPNKSGKQEDGAGLAAEPNWQGISERVFRSDDRCGSAALGS